jgi:PKD repeat protein
MKHKLMIIAFIALMALVLMPVQAADQILPITSCEWYSTSFVGNEVLGHGIGNACDNNTATYAQHTNGSNTGDLRVKFSVWGGDQVKQCQWYPQNYASYWTFANSTTNNTALMYSAGNDVYNSWTTNKTTNDTHKTFYLGSYTWPINLAEIRCYGTPDLIPVSDFVGAPTNGTAPLYVVFTDTSQNERGTCTYNWSITPPIGVTGATGTLEDHTAMFSTEGNYTISHGVSCDGGSNTSTKTDYIMVLNGSVLGTLYITAINSLNGYPIQGATLNLNDVENGTWANATTTTGTSQITGIKTHTVNVYASSPGFADNDKLGIPISNVYDSILLFPANMSNVSAGNVTLFVSVYEGDDHTKPIPNAGVNVIGPNGGSGQYTNGGGTAQFAVANKTTYLVDVQASGHRGATASVYSGTGSGGSASVTVTVYLDKNTITPTATQTTFPGGGTPTPVVTVLPGCEINPSSPECQASQNNEAMAWISANGLGLVQFFVLCFIVFMVKGLGRK